MNYQRLQSKKVFIHGCGVNSALGQNITQFHQRLIQGHSPDMVTLDDWLVTGKSSVVGQVKGDLPAIAADFKHQNTRNNRLALSALVQIENIVRSAIDKYGENRIAVIVGTSTSGISDGEFAVDKLLETGDFPADYHYYQQELGNLSDFIADYFGIKGPSYSISTACTSSGKAFISAKNLLNANMVDAVIVGGCDSLCRLTLNGFNGLEALSSQLCSPFSQNRNGINIGEGAAFMLMTNDPSDSDAPLRLLGVGESSDAHHISAPHPEGFGAETSMKMALNDAGLTAEDIGYINAHGTATELNDAMEAKAINRLFSDSVPVSSTKPLTGHALGAASAIEAAICLHILQYNLPLPMQSSRNGQDKNLSPIQLIHQATKLNRPAILSNSFAFGGNNVSLIFGTYDD